MDNKPPIKVIIDTNFWISFLIGKQLAKTLLPIFSPQLLNEINLVTKRPKLQKHFPQSKVQELLELLSIIGLCKYLSKINYTYLNTSCLLPLNPPKKKPKKSAKLLLKTG